MKNVYLKFTKKSNKRNVFFWSFSRVFVNIMERMFMEKFLHYKTTDALASIKISYDFTQLAGGI